MGAGGDLFMGNWSCINQDTMHASVLLTSQTLRVQLPHVSCWSLGDWGGYYLTTCLVSACTKASTRHGDGNYSDQSTSAPQSASQVCREAIRCFCQGQQSDVNDYYFAVWQLFLRLSFFPFYWLLHISMQAFTSFTFSGGGGCRSCHLLCTYHRGIFFQVNSRQASAKRPLCGRRLFKAPAGSRLWEFICFSILFGINANTSEYKVNTSVHVRDAVAWSMISRADWIVQHHLFTCLPDSPPN